VAFTRGRYVIGLALVLSVVYLGAVFSNPEPIARLANPSDALGFASTLLHALFLVMTIIAGIAANMRPAPGPVRRIA
jgi:Na+-driven multidrug efflux pump